MSNDDARPWEDKTKAPGERARAPVTAMSLDQKIAQLHGAMETIDIYAIGPRVLTRPSRGSTAR